MIAMHWYDFVLSATHKFNKYVIYMLLQELQQTIITKPQICALFLLSTKNLFSL